MNAPVTVIVIAQNEELNIGYCLKSVRDWCSDLFVVDSFSSDKTASIAQEQGATVVEHMFEDWGLQRNWALDTLPIKNDWVLFLDADEQATEAFKKEVVSTLEVVPPEISAFYLNFDFVFMGHHLKHAYSSPPLIRLVRRGHGRWRAIGAREYCAVNGKIASIKSRIWHEDRRGLSIWIEKQSRNASREAHALLQKMQGKDLQKGLIKTSERSLRLLIRDRVYQRLPPLVRPWLYFFYRYLLRGEFLDGSAGFTFSFLQGLWLSILIDAKYLELLRQSKDQDESV